MYPAPSPMRPLPFLLALALAVPVAAQVPSVDIGVAGGVNFSSLEDASSLSLDQSTGYHLGLFADVGVPFFSARTGVFYLWAGDFADAVSVDGASPGIRFITVPVDFQIQTPTPVVKLYGLVGPEFRFPLDDYQTLSGTFNRQNVDTVVNVGAGIKGGLPLFGPSAFVEGRYSIDLTGLRDTEVESEKARLNVFLVRVGLGL